MSSVPTTSSFGSFSPRLLRRLRNIKSELLCVRENGTSPRPSVSAASLEDFRRDRSMSSPGNIVLRRIVGTSGGSSIKVRPLKVLVLGQGGVGKTAFSVRFLTKRFIGEYAPTLEQQYPPCHIDVDGDTVAVELFDTASQEESYQKLPEQIKWADAFILMYSIIDKCSYDEVSRLKMLIWVHKRQHRRSSSGRAGDIPIALVANKNDIDHERMVSTSEGDRLSQSLSCSRFYEISVRDSYKDVQNVVCDLYRDWRGQHSHRTSVTTPVPETSDSSILRRKEYSSSSEEDRKSVSTVASEDRQSTSIGRKFSRVFRRGAVTRTNDSVNSSRSDVSNSLIKVNDVS